MRNLKIVLLNVTFIVAFLLVPAVALGVTTVGNDVSVGGTLGVTGATTLTNVSSTNYSASGYLDVNGATTLDGTVTLGDAATDSITATGYFLTSLNVGNGTGTTSTLGINTLAVAKAPSFDVGKFYVDSSGNVTASGTLGIVSTATFTGAVVANGNVTLGDAATDSITATGYFLTSLNVGNGTGTTSTLGINTLAVAKAPSFDVGKFYVDSSGNVTASGTLAIRGLFTPTGGISTSTLDGVVIGGSTVAAGSFAALSATGATVLNGNVTLGDAATDSITATGYFLTSISVGNGTNATSTLLSTGLRVGINANDNMGKFSVNPTGNVSASGTIRTVGTSGSTSTMWAGGLEGIIGQICFGDADGSGATCIGGDDGAVVVFATSTY